MQNKEIQYKDTYSVQYVRDGQEGWTGGERYYTTESIDYITIFISQNIDILDMHRIKLLSYNT